MSKETNKFGVPYHDYEIFLIDGTKKIVNVGYEEDWGNIQQCTPDDCPEWQDSIGWGNDLDGHTEITKVIDLETDEVLNPLYWAKNFVWKYVNNYSS